MKVEPGFVLTFENGIIGTVTKAMKLAICGPSGHTVRREHMPDLEAYNELWSVVRIENRIGSDSNPLTLIWEDETYSFAKKKYFADFTAEEVAEIKLAA